MVHLPVAQDISHLLEDIFAKHNGFGHLQAGSRRVWNEENGHPSIHSKHIPILHNLTIMFPSVFGHGSFMVILKPIQIPFVFLNRSVLQN